MIRQTTGLVATVVLVLGLAAQAAWSAHLDHTVTFDEGDLTVVERNGYDVITLRGCDLTREIGLPQLPVFPLTLTIPSGATVTQIEILEAASSERVVELRPMPAQHPRILPVPGLDIPARPFVDADPSVYGGRRPYPASLAELSSDGLLGDARLVGVSVHPVQFLPGVSKLRFFSTISIRLHYEPADEEVPRTHLASQRRDHPRALRERRRGPHGRESVTSLGYETHGRGLRIRGHPRQLRLRGRFRAAPGLEDRQGRAVQDGVGQLDNGQLPGRRRPRAHQELRGGRTQHLGERVVPPRRRHRLGSDETRLRDDLRGRRPRGRGQHRVRHVLRRSRRYLERRR